MSANKRAIWVCNVCGQHVAPVGSEHLQGALRAHRAMTCPKSTVSIKNVSINPEENAQ